MKIERSLITFTSGRTIKANDGIVGLAPDLSISGGYDTRIGWPTWLDPDEDGYVTAEDMRELADHMIEQWTRFKSSLDRANDQHTRSE